MILAAQCILSHRFLLIFLSESVIYVALATFTLFLPCCAFFQFYFPLTFYFLSHLIHAFICHLFGRYGIVKEVFSFDFEALYTQCTIQFNTIQYNIFLFFGSIDRSIDRLIIPLTHCHYHPESDMDDHAEHQATQYQIVTLSRLGHHQK
jgi:hypothetical protein